MQGELWTAVQVYPDGSIGAPSKDPWVKPMSLEDALGIARQLYGEDGAAFSSFGNIAL